MRRVLFFLVIFLFSVWLGLKISHDPGFAYFSYQHWSVEMPLWFAFLALLLLVAVIYFFVHMLDSVDITLYRFRNWMQWRRRSKSYSKTNRGLLDLIEGNWRGAESYLLDGIPQSDEPLINYLGAAKAAHQQGAYDKRDSYIRKAYDLVPNAELAIGLTQAQLLYEQGQLEQALATLKNLREIAPKNAMILKLLERLYVRLGDWQELLSLLPSLRKANLLTDDQIETFERKIYQELFKQAHDKSEGVCKLNCLWDNLPRRLQKDHDMMLSYVEYMLPYPEASTELEGMLSTIIKYNWNERAVKLYGLLVTPFATKQLTKAESWLKDYPNQAVLFLTLGRLSMRCQLWGKARNYFENSLKLEVNTDTYVELGRLLETLGEQNAAAKSYRDGLLLQK